jgi:hypothetical protein
MNPGILWLAGIHRAQMPVFQHQTGTPKASQINRRREARGPGADNDCVLNIQLYLPSVVRLIVRVIPHVPREVLLVTPEGNGASP